MSNNSGEDVFELLKELKDSNTNLQLSSYFRFTQFYGLLDPVNSAKYEEIDNKLYTSHKQYLLGVGLTLFFSYMLYKRNYSRISLSVLSLGGGMTLLIDYQSSQEINFELLQLKDDYIYKVDKFFKENKNPMILNPNFLNENLIDPNLQKYQEFLRNKSKSYKF